MPYPTDHPLDGRGADTATEIVRKLDLRAASPAVWREVEALRTLNAAMLAACKQAAELHEDDEGIAQVLLAAIALAEGRAS